MREITRWITFGICAGFGYMVAQDLWWLLIGMANICRG